MKHLTIAATVVAVVPLLLGIFLMKDFRLSDNQNEFDHADLSGKVTHDDDSSYNEESEAAAEDNKKVPVAA